MSHSYRNASNGLGQALQVESSLHVGELLNPFLLGFGSQSCASRRLLTRLSLLATSQAKGLAKIVSASLDSSARVGCRELTGKMKLALQ